MLTPEHFVRTRAKMLQSSKSNSLEFSGFDIPKLARNKSAEVPNPSGEYIIFLQSGNRFYKLSRSKSAILIDGFAYWEGTPQNTQSPFPDYMIPIFVMENGGILADGGRISPLDGRLSVTAHDLEKG